ncbi:Endo-1,4-beta-xylanase [Minicystis rosea]|nr:Endo-1,4-beta-xylanase [Minicystis rosea]
MNSMNPSRSLLRRSSLLSLAALSLVAMMAPAGCTQPSMDEDEGEDVAAAQQALGTNLAYGKATSQSSTYTGSNASSAAASLAVDGNTNGNFQAGSVTHTNNDAQAWWQVDLGSSQAVGNVVLWSRTDCCSDRLSNFYLRVSDDGVNWQSYAYPGTAPAQLTFAVNRTARYVKVQLAGQNYLSLAEVQVFAPGGYEPILAKHSGKCLDINGGSTADGAGVIQWPCHSGPNQRFAFAPLGNGYSIKVMHSGKCLEVPGSDIHNGTPIQQSTCTGAQNQKWQTLWQADGNYLLQNAGTGKCFDVYGGYTTDGTAVTQYDCAGYATNQHFGVHRQIHDALALRYAPKIWLHSEESYWPSSVELALANTHQETYSGQTYLVTNQALGCPSCTDPAYLTGQNPSQATVPAYAEIVNRTSNGQPTNTTDIIYWMFYPYNNGKRVCIGSMVPYIGCIGGYSTFGNHVGDWEHMTIRFVDGVPSQVYLSQHSGGVTYTYGDSALFLDNGRPTVFAALGSHGLYNDDARHTYGTIPVSGDTLNDDTDHGTVWDTAPGLVTLTPQSTSWPTSWLAYTGRWGNPKQQCDLEWASGECTLNDGPESILPRSLSNPAYWTLE